METAGSAQATQAPMAPQATTPTGRAGTARPRWVPAFVALGAIWGSSFLFIKIGIAELPPVYVTLARLVIGAVTLLIYLALTGDRLPRSWRIWAHLSLVAALVNVIAFTLFAYGERYVSSIVAGIWNGTTPLLTLIVVMALLPDERPTRQRVIGVGVGFLGVLTVLGVWRGVSGAALIGQLLCLGAALCYGFSYPYAKRFVTGGGESGASIAAAQILLATAQMAIAAPLIAGAPPAPWRLSGAVLLALGLLGALGTGIAFVLSYHVIRVAGATTAATVTYLIPVFATGFGVALLHERLSWNEPVGAAVVLAGVAIAQGAFQRRTRPGRPS